MEQKNKKPARSVLGRGLSALISTAPVAINRAGNLAESLNESEIAKQEFVSEKTGSEKNEEGSVRFVDINLVVNNPTQPRQEFQQQELQELSESIKTLGVLQPVLVRPGRGENKDKYEIIAGERRWRASNLAKLQKIPVQIIDVDDKQTLEIALVENIQRAALNPVEEAQAYEKLMNDFNLSQKEISERVGKDRASIANYMRLLNLAPEVLELLKNGKISMGHAKAILTIKEPSAQISLAKKVVGEGLSVRALEAIVSRVVVLDGHRPMRKNAEANQKSSAHSTSFPEVVDRMRNRLGTKVNIKHHQSGRGRIEIEYFSEQELDRVIELICS